MNGNNRGQHEDQEVLPKVHMREVSSAIGVENIRWTRTGAEGLQSTDFGSQVSCAQEVDSFASRGSRRDDVYLVVETEPV